VTKQIKPRTEKCWGKAETGGKYETDQQQQQYNKKIYKKLKKKTENLERTKLQIK